jgi:carboxymethylenebutenolidase
MCTDEVFAREARRRRALTTFTRRDINWLALSAAAVSAWPVDAGLAPALVEAQVAVTTKEGVADCFFVHPKTGRHPGVVIWSDFMGLRPVYQQMARQLAQSGYAVLVMNPYYRGHKAPVVQKVDFDDKALMQTISSLMKALTPEAVQADAQAFVAFLDTQPAVDTRRPIGTLGYCAGGAHALQTAAAVPSRVGAFAAFHAGLVDTDTPDRSPHRLIAKVKGQALVGISTNDDEASPQDKTTLKVAFDAAKVPAEIEVYKDTQHGWCIADMIAFYNAPQAQRAWSRLLALYARALKA